MGVKTKRESQILLSCSFETSDGWVRAWWWEFESGVGVRSVPYNSVEERAKMGRAICTPTQQRVPTAEHLWPGVTPMSRRGLGVARPSCD